MLLNVLSVALQFYSCIKNVLSNAKCVVKAQMLWFVEMPNVVVRRNAKCCGLLKAKCCGSLKAKCCGSLKAKCCGFLKGQMLWFVKRPNVVVR